MSNTPKLALGIFTALVILVAAAALVWLRGRGGEGTEPPAERLAATPLPTPEPTPSLQERLSDRLKGVSVNTSDEVIRQLAAGLSARPELASWLMAEDLVRRFVASVDNIADGRSPHQHIDFLRPAAPFAVQRRGDLITIDRTSYRRYDLAATVFVSLDVAGSVSLYRELKPLIDDAYAEISPPGRQFDDRLVAAIDHLLEVPELDGDVQLEEKVITYSFADARLEALSGAQRQLLRMGPDNARTVQEKLSEFRAALGR